MTADVKILPEPNKKYRLITRSDMDGLVCGIILKELDLIDDVLFAHPKDMQDQKVEVSVRDKRVVFLPPESRLGIVTFHLLLLLPPITAAHCGDGLLKLAVSEGADVFPVQLP